jgi:hypothetical protein
MRSLIVTCARRSETDFDTRSEASLETYRGRRHAPLPSFILRPVEPPDYSWGSRTTEPEPT